MRTVNLSGRLHLIHGGRALDVHDASDGRFDADPQAVFARWEEFRGWAAAAVADQDAHFVAFDVTSLGPPAPHPSQVFAVGLNYSAHADESGFVEPAEPLIFTKYVSSLAGPVSTVELPAGSVDWEVELVAVIARGGRDIAAVKAWDHIAGLCVGQDLSERQRQHAGPAPQFGLAKSHKGFSPIGPALVTIDELSDPDDLEIGASINGEIVQQDRTRRMIFSVPELVERISAVVELLPGDLIFTGTPSGVGAGRTPPRFLQPGDVLRSHIEGLGTLEQTFVAAAPSALLSKAAPSALLSEAAAAAAARD